MKSVGNLNEFVRDHMLEPSDASGRVRDIIAHFEDLTKAHDAVKRAREQLEALDPIVATAEKYDAALTERADQERQRDAVRLFVAESRSRMLGEEIAAQMSEAERLFTEKSELEVSARRLESERDDLIAERARAGGDRIGELERLSRAAHEQAEERAKRRALFDAAVKQAGYTAVEDQRDFSSLTTNIADKRAELKSRRSQIGHEAAGLLGEISRIDREAGVLTDELDSLTKRTSNLPASHTDLREQLCRDLGLTPEELPYAGELLDVVEGQSEWRGAAERVLRGFALSLLVPQARYDEVARWVNGRRLSFRGRDGRQVGTKLVYERVPDRRVPLRPTAHDHLILADCLETKAGAFADYLADELIKRADYRCVDTLVQFGQERRAVTREGQVRSGERHEKDDRTRVDDPRTWVLGWANERKIAALHNELQQLKQAKDTAEKSWREVEAEREDAQHRLDAFTSIAGFPSWSDLDVAEARGRASQHEEEKARLEAGSSRLAELKLALGRVEKQQGELKARANELIGRLAKLQASVQAAETEKARDDSLVAEQSTNDLSVARAAYEALDARLGKKRPAHSGEWPDIDKSLTEQLTKRIEQIGRELGGYSQSLGQYMAEVLRRWPELRSEMDATAEARADYVALHASVRDDDLPRFEAEFKRQLNTETIRELAQFNSWLRRQAEEIDERVSKINEALGAIPYNPGHYIRLEKQPTVNQDVSSFRSDLRSATDDALSGDDDHYSEQRFLDVKRIIERFRGREGYADSDKAWTRRVTDVRNWFVFSASERILETDEEWEHYSDSDGKSGGQKEKLAYTILAASLAYQFGLEWGAEKSRDFRFAVIDEAFGRGSDVSTRYALELFAKLGLQLLIVTPLQKVHVIEPYVKAIGFVDNPSGTFSRLQTMTIEEYRARRDGRAS